MGQGAFEQISTCFLVEQCSHNICYMLSIDLPFFRSTFTVGRLWRGQCLLKEIRCKFGIKYNNVLWIKYANKQNLENQMDVSAAGSVHIWTMHLSKLSHLPANRLSADVSLIISKPLKVDDLRRSPKDLCSSLLEWDIAISIHQAWNYHCPPPCP